MTSTEDVDVIRYGLKEETDMRVCLLNYRKNGTAFLNQFNLSPLRDTSGKVVRKLAARLAWLVVVVDGGGGVTALRSRCSGFVGTFCGRGDPTSHRLRV